MAANTSQITKRLLINKANSRIVLYVGVAAFIVVFSLIATKTLISQAGYQNRVISAKKTTVTQLHTNIAATDQLKKSYNAFKADEPNLIGGGITGSGPKDGDNAKIVLDALPSSYDFPGLATSLNALFSIPGVTVSSITGTDDELTQGANQSSVTPSSVPIPFSLSATSDYAGVQNVVGAFEKSIRPLQIQTLSISSSSGLLTTSIAAQTYYQPAKALNITSTTVK